MCRTTPREESKKTTDGMSVLLVDMREAVGNGLTIRPIRTMLNHATTELFFDNMAVPVENRIGEEGKGFRYILDGMNAERILIASECIGDGRFFVERAAGYAKNPRGVRPADRPESGRPVPDRPLLDRGRYGRAYGGQGGADVRGRRALRNGSQHAKLLASEASWRAADMCVQTHGGFGFAEEFDIERKFRETRLYQVAPISTNLILAHVGTHVLDLPRSY